MKEQENLRTIYDQLKKFQLSDALYVIGSVNAALKYGTVKPVRKNIPGWIWDWLQREGTDELRRRSIGIILSRMARFLLLSQANDHKGVLLDLNTAAASKAYGLVMNEGPEDGDEPFMERFAVHFHRIGQFQFPLQASRKWVTGRGYMLFHDVMAHTPTDYDFDAKFRQYFGLSLFQFMATGFAMWLLCNGTLDYEMRNEVASLQGIVTLDTQHLFLSLCSGTPRQYREMVRGVKWQHVQPLKDRYAPEPLMMMPAVKVDRSPLLRAGTYVVPQPKYLLDRASSGIFYLLGDWEMALAQASGKAGRNPFRAAFGTVYRAYVGRHLALPGKQEFIDLDHDFEKVQGKVPDLAIVRGNVCVLFEVKTTLLDIAARSYFEQDKLEEAVHKGNILKAKDQLREFKMQVLEGKLSDSRLRGVDTVTCVVVGYDDIFCLNSTLLPALDKLEGTILDDLQFASISDIEAIGAAISFGSDVVATIQEKAADPVKRQWALATTFPRSETGTNPLLDAAYDAFMLKMGLPHLR